MVEPASNGPMSVADDAAGRVDELRQLWVAVMLAANSATLGTFTGAAITQAGHRLGARRTARRGLAARKRALKDPAAAFGTDVDIPSNRERIWPRLRL